MLLSHLEFFMMNNPIRRAIQWRFEARRFLRMAGPLPGAKALEIGCGQGVGVEILLDVFKVTSVDAFDLDPRMMKTAEHRLSARHDQVRLWVGDATAIDAPDNIYDAVFDFGIIHHVVGWRRALTEVNRVLVPGGLFFVEEPVGWMTKAPPLARLFGYSKAEAARVSEIGFTVSELRSALTTSGFNVQQEEHLLRVFAWFVAAKAKAALRADGN